MQSLGAQGKNLHGLTSTTFHWPKQATGQPIPEMEVWILLLIKGASKNHDHSVICHNPYKQKCSLFFFTFSLN